MKVSDKTELGIENGMTTNFRNIWLSITVATLIGAILACSATYQPVDPTLIAPNDLSGEDLSFKDMAGFDFSGKNLRGVDFTQSDLQGANFSNSDCSGTIFDNAKLEGANFTGAVLDEKWNRIIDLLITGNGSGQDFEKYDLSKTYLAGYDLSGANLRKADLAGANMSNIDLRDANLTFSDLQEASLDRADLRNADLTGAILYNTQLHGAILSNAIVAPQQLQFAFLGCTRLPDGTIYKENECYGSTPEP